MSVVRIAHLSDPHFGTVLPKVEAALVASLHELAPDLILISGDITQRARRRQFQAAAAFRSKLQPVPCFAAPGNHDIPLFNLLGRLLAPYYGFHKYFQRADEIDFKFDGVRVIALNSTSRWRHIQGSLNLRRIRETFLANWDNSAIRIAMVHHPLDCAKNIDDKNRLKGKEPTIQLFREAQVDLVLSGHVHDPYLAIENGMVLSVAGTCLSWRTREGAPNSFNWIEIDSQLQTIKITRMDIAGDGRFRPRQEWIREFKRGEKGWV